MKQHIYHLLFLVSFFAPFFTNAQSEIISLAPSAALPGETVNIAITGENTNFLPGRTTIDLGPGIQVLDLQVTHALFLTAIIRFLRHGGCTLRHCAASFAH